MSSSHPNAIPNSLSPPPGALLYEFQWTMSEAPLRLACLTPVYVSFRNSLCALSFGSLAQGHELEVGEEYCLPTPVTLHLGASDSVVASAEPAGVHFRGTLRYRGSAAACDPDQFNSNSPKAQQAAWERLRRFTTTGSNGMANADPAVVPLLGQFRLPDDSLGSNLFLGWMTDTILAVGDHNSYGNQGRIGFYDFAKNGSLVGELRSSTTGGAFRSTKYKKATALHPPIVQMPEWNGNRGALMILPYDCAIGQVTVSATVAATGKKYSDLFGDEVYFLSNGDVLVMDNEYQGDAGSTSDAGLVRHCKGQPGSCIGVSSSCPFRLLWDGERGGGDGGAGGMARPLHTVQFFISPLRSNSLVGSVYDSRIGWDSPPDSPTITELPDGNYLVRSPHFAPTPSSSSDAGAVTGRRGCEGSFNGFYVVYSSTWYSSRGFVAVGNSTTCWPSVGTTAGDMIGTVTPLDPTGTSANIIFFDNGNFLMFASTWKNVATSAASAGAVSFFNPSAGIIPVGAVSETTALIGTVAYDWVGNYFLYLPTTGNYVLYRSGSSSPKSNGWVHWCSGTTGCVGKRNEVAQLQGGPTTSTNFICSTLTRLANDNFVVSSPRWSDGSTTAAGFAMLCSGTSGCPSTVSAATALIGSGANQKLGNSVTGLPDGSYVVTSQPAVTHCPPTGCNGTSPTSDSLTGFGIAENTFITALSTGEYVVSCPLCTVGGVTGGGFVARCGADGSGCKGHAISAQTGLVGTAGDGSMGNHVAEVANASLVVSYEGFDGGKGGVFWFSATDPVIGTVSAAMGLTGDSTDQKIGAGGIYVTPNKDYVSYASTTRILTWCPGATGCRGVTVSTANSVTGLPEATQEPTLKARAAGDYILTDSQDAAWLIWGPKSGPFQSGPYGETTALTGIGSAGSISLVDLPNNAFLIGDMTTLDSKGAFTWCSGTSPCVGTVSATRSLTGELANDMVRLDRRPTFLGSSPFDRRKGLLTCPNTQHAPFAHAPLQVGDPYQVTLSQEAVPAHYIVRWWRSDNSASSVTVCPTAGGCVGVVTDPAVSLVGTATQPFQNDYAPWLWFLPNGPFRPFGDLPSSPPIVVSTSCITNTSFCFDVVIARCLLQGNLLVRAAGEPGGASQGQSFFMCVPGPNCNGTLSASNTFHGDYFTSIFMPPVGSAQYNASSYYAAIASAAGGLGAVRLCSGVSFDCAGDFTAANAAVGSAEHTGFGAIVVPDVNGIWVRHQDASYSYVPFVNGTLPTGPVVTQANWQSGSSSSVVLDLTSTPLGPIYANGDLGTVSIGLNQQYHNHFEALYAESAEDEVILRLWVDEPVQMIGWAASMEVVDPSSGNVTQTLVFNESGRARVQSCTECTFAAGVYPGSQLYRAQIKLTPAVFFTVPNWDTMLDFHPAPTAQVTPTSCTITGTCTVHINVSGPGAVAPYRVTLDGEECTVQGDSTATDVHVTLPTGKSIGSYSLKVTSAGGRFAVLSFEYTPANPVISGVTPACPAHGCAITITGTAFSQPTVRMDGVAMTCPTVTSTSITCQAPATSVAEGHTITVTNSNGLAVTASYAYNIPHPTISGVSPQVEATGGDITITGSGFLEPVVTIGGACCAVVSSTATQIVCTAPQAPAEHCNLTVISAGGYAAFGTYTYIGPHGAQPPPHAFGRPLNDYIALTIPVHVWPFAVHRPTVTGASPACGPLGCQITVQGSDFHGPTVTIDGVACPLVGNATATSLTCTAPASTREATNLTVIDAGGFAASIGYQYSFPHPTISGVSPQVEATGGDITITGSGFLGPVVTIGGAACAVVSSTATQIVCTAPQAPAEHCNLTVISTGGYAAFGTYTYRVHRPTVTGASPACGPLGCQITVQGSDFYGPTVTIDGVACPLVGSATATSLTCTAPASTREATNLTVIDAGGFAASIGYQYSFPHPVISGVSPQVEATGGDIIITGSGFLEPMVTIGGASCAVVSSTATQIVCTAPQAPAEHCNLTVISTGGYAAFGTYTYRVHRPTVTGASPACGPLGCQITVQGSDFHGPTVTIDGVACPLVGSATATSLTCTAPASTREATNLTVIDAGGFAASIGYQYSFPHPTISGVSPQVETTGGDITITGSGFLEPVVTIGGAACAVVSSTATQIVCTAPQAPAEHCNLTVISAGGYAAFGTYTYRVHRPTVTGASPACGPLGCQITVQGSDFHGPTVTIDGVACPLVGSPTATSLTCTAPASTREATNLTVIDAGGFAASIGYQYSFPHPTISGISPSCALAGCDVTIAGSDFLNPTVTLAGATLTCSSSTATEIHCPVPASTTEFANLTVVDLGGYACSATYTYQVTQPVLTGCTPAFCPAATGCLLSLSGSAFEQPAVSLGTGAAAVSCTLVSASATAILAQCPPSTFHGAQPVTVTNAGGRQASRPVTVQGQPPCGTANTRHRTLAWWPVEDVFLSFSCSSSPLSPCAFPSSSPPGLTPTFASVTPAVGPAVRVAPFPVTITGANFWAADGGATCPTVTIGGVACAVTACTATSIGCTLGAGSRAAGAADVVVTNPDQVTGTLLGAYTFQDVAPTLTGLVGAAAGPLAGGNTVTLAGTGLRAGAQVTVGGRACTGLSLQAGGTRASCTVPAGDAAGLVDVVLTNSDLTTASLPAAYAYQGVSPVVSLVWPVSGPTSGSTGLTLTGSGFRAGATVLLGGLPCTAVVVHNATTITCTSPPGAEAKVNVTVTNTDLTSAVLVQGFEYTPVGSPVYPPVFISVSPATGKATTSTLVTIMCSNVRAGVTVTVGGRSCTGLTLTGSRIRCTVPAGGTVGPADVTLRNSDGISTTSVGAFTFTGTTPAVTGVSPTSLTAASGPTTITVTGSDFRAGCTVKVGSLPCTGIVIAADGKSLQCTVNAASMMTAMATNDGEIPLGPMDIVVTNIDGSSATLVSSFYYQAEAPTLSGVSPRRGSFKAATRVTLTGTHLRANATVLVGGQACLEVEVLTSETVRAYVPPPPEGTPTGADWVTDVQLLNYDMTSATLQDAFTYLAATATSDEDYLTVGGVSGGSIALFVVGALMLAGGLVAILIIALVVRRRRRSNSNEREQGCDLFRSNVLFSSSEARHWSCLVGLVSTFGFFDAEHSTEGRLAA
ncbi:putative zymogen granule membrane glycoprotein [Paratrimastix pyriformis]|uniref:Zymogen granule membrane glycoprotein n=1 Tax=Paratrimastix pyriformis TaxID=342808 RepID=A0ABQ8UT05_9EUKA|nr:putative zymogen granule membrane glycoprotein [Paratrimastix pyriformis]